jgi:hypothetical protein
LFGTQVMTLNFDRRNALKNNPRWPAGAVWLAGLGLLFALCLTAHAALDAAYLPATAQAGAMLPAAGSLLDDNASDEALLPTPGLAEQPRSARVFSLTTLRFPPSAAPRPAPRPPQLPAA